MSTEQTRKVVLACEAAGFLDRRKTAFGTMVVRSTGVMERVFGGHLRDLRGRINEAGRRSDDGADGTGPT